MKTFDKQLTRCICCDSRDIKLWKQKMSDNIVFNFWRCNDCKVGFMNPRPDFEWLKNIYSKSGLGLSSPTTLKEVLDKEVECPNVTVDARRIISGVLNILPNDKSLKALDIGSGYGFFSAAALKQGFEVAAINPSIWENDVFEAMNGFRPVESTFEESDFNSQSEAFDLVILSQVLEHIYDPAIFLNQIHKLLKKNGVLAIAVPNFNSIRVRLLGTRDNSCLWCPEHVSYFTINSLSLLLNKVNFSVINYHNISRMPYFAISDLLNLNGWLRKIVNNTTKYAQKSLSICDITGTGFYLNLWAKKL